MSTIHKVGGGSGKQTSAIILLEAEIERLHAENARMREALEHAEAAMEGMASDQLTAVETANLWNATMESIRTALEEKS
jgi:hypothetical protein